MPCYSNYIGEWISEHYILTFILAYCAISVGATLVTRTQRFVMVLFRGWPPKHLDADGDWAKEGGDEKSHSSR